MAGLILGFTGTRHRITDLQRTWLKCRLKSIAELHHGGCVNADEEAHDIAILDESITIVVHPPINESLMMPKWKWSDRAGIYVLGAKPYLDRNRDVVDSCDTLIALPDGPERAVGGTWYTVRYATSVGKTVSIRYPSGTIEVRYPDGTKEVIQ